MRQIFSSQRLENVEGVAKLLRDAGIETYVSEARSYKGNRRGTFKYSESERGMSQPGVWIVNADDVTRARQLLVDAKLIESTKPDSYLPRPPDSKVGTNVPLARAHRFRLAVLMILSLAVIATMVKACAPEPPEDRSHIVPVYTSPP